MTIPIYIIAYNNLTYVKNMISQCQKFTTDIHIIDNCSTYPELLKYYKTEYKYELIRLNYNIGPRQSIIQLYNMLPEKFVVTDPDLEFGTDMPKNFLEQLLKISEKYQQFKVGLALDISEPEKYICKKYNGKEYPVEWESQYWKRKLDDDQYELYWADIDTTFALYNKAFKAKDFFSSIRVAGKFTCKHLPWYKSCHIEVPEDELKWYRIENNASTVYMNSEGIVPK